MSVVLATVMMFAGAANAAPVDVHASLKPSEIPFYKEAIYKIIVEAPASLEVHMPDMKGKLGGLNVDGAPRQRIEPLGDGRRRITVAYSVGAAKLGNYRIGPVDVTWGKSHHAVAPALVLRVRDVTPAEKADVERFDPIVEPRAPRFAFLRRGEFWVIVGALIALVALAAWLVARRRRGVIGAPDAPLEPWEVAYARLRALEAAGLDAAGDFGPYYVELSAILREYIEGRFQIHAPEQTTPEFLADAARSGVLSGEHQRLLAGILRHSDRVKFARHEPGVEDMKQNFLEVRRFVDETVPAREDTSPSQEEVAA